MGNDGPVKVVDGAGDLQEEEQAVDAKVKPRNRFPVEDIGRLGMVAR